MERGKDRGGPSCQSQCTPGIQGLLYELLRKRSGMPKSLQCCLDLGWRNTSGSSVGGTGQEATLMGTREVSWGRWVGCEGPDGGKLKE